MYHRERLQIFCGHVVAGDPTPGTVDYITQQNNLRDIERQLDCEFKSSEFLIWSALRFEESWRFRRKHYYFYYSRRTIFDYVVVQD